MNNYLLRFAVSLVVVLYQYHGYFDVTTGTLWLISLDTTAPLYHNDTSTIPNPVYIMTYDASLALDRQRTLQSYYYLNRTQSHDFADAGEFFAVMGAKTGYLCRHDARQPHGPGNSYWGARHPAPPRATGPRTPRWHLHRCGALTLIMPTGRHLPHGAALTSEWIALCDCGRTCRVTSARFKRRRHCRHAQCTHKHVRAVYRGEQPRTPAIDAVLSDLWHDRPLQPLYPSFA